MRAFVVAGKAPTSSVFATGLPGSEGGTDDSELLFNTMLLNRHPWIYQVIGRKLLKGCRNRLTDRAEVLKHCAELILCLVPSAVVLARIREGFGDHTISLGGQVGQSAANMVDGRRSQGKGAESRPGLQVSLSSSFSFCFCFCFLF
jgi:hypothetical protein